MNRSSLAGILILVSVLLVSVNSAGATEIYTNPACYSAATMPPAEMDAWIATNLNPALYDIWFDKKPRTYLHGAWKLVKLNTTNHLDNTGEHAGFWKADFDDRPWFNQPVPWSLDFKFPVCDTTEVISHKARVDWYRRHFAAPSIGPGQRVILHFEGINRDAVVWVNGTKVIEQHNLPTRNDRDFGQRNENFEVDITDQIDFKKDNVVAVRSSFDMPDRFGPLPGQGNYPPHMRGIWQEVYLETRPAIYLDRALITPVLREGKIMVKALVVNTTKSVASVQLKVNIEPWVSGRYQAPGAPLPTEAALGAFKLGLGENELQFEVKLNKPIPWSPENPCLYRFQLRNGQELIGQERFGLRGITAGANAFFLNGRKIYFRAEQFEWSAACNHLRTPLMDQLFQLNYAHSYAIAMDYYLKENLNLTRTHSTQWTHSFYDLADEKGLLIYDEENWPEMTLEEVSPLWFEKGALSPFFAEKVKHRIYCTYNNPSVILCSLGNEFYDLYYGDFDQKWDWSMYLNPLRKEWKKYDQGHPLTPSSGGRTPTIAANAKIHSGLSSSKDYVETDFHDMHNYNSGALPVVTYEDDGIDSAYKRCYQTFQLDHPGTNRVVLNGETIWTGYQPLNIPHEFVPDIIRSNRIDRKQLLAMGLEGISSNKFTAQRINIGLGRWGLLNAVTEDNRAKHAETYRRIIEQHRRKREWVAGWVANTPGDYLANPSGLPGPVPDPVVYPVIQRACQPVQICLDGLHDRNFICGHAWSDKLYIMNDRENEITDLQVNLKLAGPSNETSLVTLKRERLGVGDMEVMPFTVKVPEMPSGHYMARLSLRHVYKGVQQESINEYPVYILGGDQRLTSVATKFKVGLYHGASRDKDEQAALEKGYVAFAAILRALSIPFKELKEFSSLGEFDLVIMPSLAVTISLRQALQSGEAGAQLDAWVQKGGHLIYAEQQYDRDPGGMACLSWRYYTEMVVPEHPLFAGLAPDDFELWSGSVPGAKRVCDYALLPLDEGVLAMSWAWANTLGLSIAEYQFGRGLILRSQVKASERYGQDAVATRYIENLLSYTLRNWTGQYAASWKPPARQAEAAAVTVNAGKIVCVDLRKQANMALKDEVAGDKQGGWSDQGPENDARALPVGRQSLLGVPFEIIDSETNQGKSIIVLQGRRDSGTDFLPVEVKGISVDGDVKRLFFLVASAWTPPDGQQVGEITIEYDSAGMAPISIIPLITGKNIADWWRTPSDLPEARLAWSSGNASTRFGIYMIEWRKPVGNDQKVKWIHIKSNQNGVLFLLAISGEK